jgi:hypothetical protein
MTILSKNHQTPPDAKRMLVTGLDRVDLIKNRRSNNMTYRECFGFKNPPKGTKLDIDHSEGIGFFIVWNDCPDDENIIEGWFKKRDEAVSYVKTRGWLC